MSESGWGTSSQEPAPPFGAYPAPPGGASRYPSHAGGGGGFVPPGGNGTALASDPSYPVTLGLQAPLQIARWRVIGNYVMAIPHFLFLYVLELLAQVVTFAAWFAIVFTGRMPDGMGNFVAGVHRYQWRVTTFALFLREPYPSFEVPSGYREPGGDPAWLDIVPARRYSRLAVLFRVVLAVPQVIFGWLLGIALSVAWVAAFFAVLFTGRWPEGLRRFVVGVEFWAMRYSAWYFLLSDPYPPFSIN